MCREVRRRVALAPWQNASNTARLGAAQTVTSGTFFPLKSNNSVVTDATIPVSDTQLGIRRHQGLVEFFARNADVNNGSKLRGTITISGGTFTNASPNPISVTGPFTGLENAFENGQGDFQDFIRITSPTTAEFAIFWSQPGDGFTLSYND